MKTDVFLPEDFCYLLTIVLGVIDQALCIL